MTRARSSRQEPVNAADSSGCGRVTGSWHHRLRDRDPGGGKEAAVRLPGARRRPRRGGHRAVRPAAARLAGRPRRHQRAARRAGLRHGRHDRPGRAAPPRARVAARSRRGPRRGRRAAGPVLGGRPPGARRPAPRRRAGDRAGPVRDRLGGHDRPGGRRGRRRGRGADRLDAGVGRPRGPGPDPGGRARGVLTGRGDREPGGGRRPPARGRHRAAFVGAALGAAAGCAGRGERRLAHRPGCRRGPGRPGRVGGPPGRQLPGRRRRPAAVPCRLGGARPPPRPALRAAHAIGAAAHHLDARLRDRRRPGRRRVRPGRRRAPGPVRHRGPDLGHRRRRPAPPGQRRRPLARPGFIRGEYRRG
jgi:hypothetical protein